MNPCSGGGQVQEQRAGDLQPEAPPLPHPVGQVPGEDRLRPQRRKQGLQDRAAEGGHCHFEVTFCLANLSICKFKAVHI